MFVLTPHYKAIYWRIWIVRWTVRADEEDNECVLMSWHTTCWSLVGLGDATNDIAEKVIQDLMNDRDVLQYWTFNAWSMDTDASFVKIGTGELSECTLAVRRDCGLQPDPHTVKHFHGPLFAWRWRSSGRRTSVPFDSSSRSSSSLIILIIIMQPYPLY